MPCTTLTLNNASTQAKQTSNGMLHRDNCSTDLGPTSSGQISLSQKKTHKPLQFSLICAFVASFWRLNRPWMNLDVPPRPALKCIKMVETITFSCMLALGLLFCPPNHCGLHFLSKTNYANIFFTVTSAWDYVYVESEMGDIKFLLFPVSSSLCCVKSEANTASFYQQRTVPHLLKWDPLPWQSLRFSLQTSDTCSAF